MRIEEKCSKFCWSRSPLLEKSPNVVTTLIVPMIERKLQFSLISAAFRYIILLPSPPIEVGQLSWFSFVFPCSFSQWDLLNEFIALLIQDTHIARGRHWDSSQCCTLAYDSLRADSPQRIELVQCTHVHDWVQKPLNQLFVPSLLSFSKDLMRSSTMFDWSCIFCSS